MDRPVTPLGDATPSLPPQYSDLPDCEPSSVSQGEETATEGGRIASTARLLTLKDDVEQAPATSPFRAYQPSTTLLPLSRQSSTASQHFPSYPPPAGTGPSYSPIRSGRTSPIRPWTPSRSSADLSRPPPSNIPFEPPDINGSPRPGTPSSRYGGTSRRPLPPAPLFSGPATTLRPPDSEPVDETTIPIAEGDDDVFSPIKANPRSSLKSAASFRSESTYTDDMSWKNYEEQYGPAPIGKQERRGARQAQMTKKEVRLINGELILECKIPTILYSFLPRRDEVEFTHMRYTAVTCDPDDFVSRGYKLRQNIGATARETELFICITMYNENEIDFTRTMHAVMRNITHFCSRSKSRTWGKDGWQKIVVCIVSDGRHKVHPRTLDALAAMGVYQDGIAKNLVNQREVTAHVYEYTTQVSLDADLKFKGAEKGIVPCQIIFCLKEKNQKKLNSHRWFFNAFGQALNPNVCILLDVGTKPGNNSLYHLWKAFDTDSSVAGACGEIKAGKGKGWLGLLNPLVASQNFEYKMSNILDKPLESVFGYITVLPGALSAYRYHALQNDHTGHGPLSQYFKGETLKGQDADVFTANMYLAEDRILCWELVAKRSERWVLKYVKSATGETDVPDAVPEFVSQRRRWLNGAFFAAVYSLIHFRQIWSTDHTIARKVLLHIEFVYQFVNLMFTFFSLANFYLTFYFIAGSLADPKLDPFGHSIGRYIFTILRFACILLICTQFILSMGNRPQGAKRMYMSSMIVYSVIMTYTTFCALFIVITQLKNPKADLRIGNNVFTNLIVSTASTLGLYFLMSFLYLDPWHMFTSSAQYFAMLPSYICTLQIYAFCNTHDVTWGTKGDNVIHTDLGAAVSGKGNTVELEMPSEQLDIDSGYDEALRNLRDRVEVPKEAISEAQMQEDYYRAVRTYMVVVWMIANAVLAMAVSEAYKNEDVANNFYLKFILWAVAAVAIFRALGSSAFGIINIIHAIADGRWKPNFVPYRLHIRAYSKPSSKQVRTLPAEMIQPALGFDLIARCSVTKARAAILHLPHGPVELPIFMPVATQGTLKGLTPEQIESTGCRIYLNNTYHLCVPISLVKNAVRLTDEAVFDLGKQHSTQWVALINFNHGHITFSRTAVGWFFDLVGFSSTTLFLSLTPSSFQMVSLLKLARVTEEGVRFLSPHDGSPMLLTPEHSISLQNSIGSDIIMQLDDVIATTSTDSARMEEAMKRSVRWLDRCLAAHKYPEKQNLFCIIQGGLDLEMRKTCCHEMMKRDTLGIAIGGLSGGEAKDSFCQVVDTCTDLLPASKPRYVMGVGYPEDLVISIALGADMFDCVWPTRTARFGNAVTSFGALNLRHGKYAEDFSPVEEGCSCICCRPSSQGGLGVTRAYIYHLAAKETAGAHLLTLHNVHYLLALMKSARTAIIEDRYPRFIKDFFAKIYGSDSSKFPAWAVTALRKVNVDLLTV